MIRAGVTAFAVGAVAAVSERHGEMPPEFHASPYAAGQGAIVMQSTSTGTVNFTSIWR